METKTFQLVDSDGEPFGLVKTHMRFDDLEPKFREWYNGEDFTGNVDDFVSHLQTDGENIERIFIDDTINP